MKKQVLITQVIPDSALELLGEHFDVIYRNKKTPIPADELIEAADNCFGIITFLSDRIDRSVLNQLKSVRIIANYAVGTNNIDLTAARESRISIANTPDVLTNATADLAMALLLSVGRRIVEADRFCRNNQFTGWESKLLLGYEFSGKSCGVIGFGRIGQAFAKRASALDMTVSYFSRTKIQDTEYIYKPLDKLLGESDVISIHLPLTDETKLLLDRDKLSLLKSNSILVNTGRGELIDESFLVELLENGKIFGAGLDVFEKEPIIHNRLKQLDNVVLTPHIGSATVEARNNMASLAANSIIAEFKGKFYPNKVV